MLGAVRARPSYASRSHAVLVIFFVAGGGMQTSAPLNGPNAARLLRCAQVPQLPVMLVPDFSGLGLLPA